MPFKPLFYDKIDLMNAIALWPLAIIILILTNRSHAHSPESFPPCPSKSFRTDFVSPVSFERRIFCSYRNQSDQIINHGAEWIYDSHQKLISKANWIEGEKFVEEMTLNVETPTIERDFGYMQTAIHEFLFMLLPVSPENRGMHFHGGFSASGCYENNYARRQFYFTEKSTEMTIRPRFNNRCSLQGEAKIYKEKFSKIRLETKLSKYYHIEMNLRISLEKNTPEENLITIEIQSGRLIEPKSQLEFEAQYKLSFNNEGKVLNKGEGIVRIITEDTTVIDRKYPLSLPAR